MTRLRRAVFIRIALSRILCYRTCVVSHRTITCCSHAISTIRYSISSIHLFLCECVPSLYQQYTTHRSHHTETPHSPSPCCSLFGLLYIYTLSTHTCRSTWIRFHPRLLSVCVHTYILSFLFVSSTCCITQHDPPCSTRTPPTRRVVDTQNSSSSSWSRTSRTSS